MNGAHLAWTILGAASGGVLANRFSVPGGLVLGAMVGAAAVSLATNASEGQLPSPLRSGALIVIGATIGAQITRQTLTTVRSVLVPAIIASLTLIAAGLLLAWVMQRIGIAPPGVVLATSPGALAVMTAAAIEQGVGVVEVAMFHLVRIVLAILSLPLLLYLMEERVG